MLNRSASLAMSTSILKALPGKLDIKRHSPSILYISMVDLSEQTCTNELTSIGHFRIQLLHGKQVRVFKVKNTLKQHVTFVCVLVCFVNDGHDRIIAKSV